MKKEGEGKKFLKKRAPFYLAGITLLLVFIVPGIMETNFDDIIPDTLDPDESQTLQGLLEYTGPNDTGISIGEAISDRIKDDYPDGNVYEHRSTTLDVAVTDMGENVYHIILDFESYNGELYFDIEMDMTHDIVKGNNNLSKDIVDLVYYYD